MTRRDSTWWFCITMAVLTATALTGAVLCGLRGSFEPPPPACEAP